MMTSSRLNAWIRSDQIVIGGTRRSLFTFSSQPLGEFGERFPTRGVHVDMLPVADVFVVDDVVVHSFGPCREEEERNQVD